MGSGTNDMSDTTRRFIEALHALEGRRDLNAMAEVFSQDAEISNPLRGEARPDPEGARHFWEQYRASFEEIHSEFLNIVDNGAVAMLEWRSDGRIVNGEPFHYGGVTVLELEGDAVRRFRTYFDPTSLGASMAGSARNT